MPKNIFQDIDPRDPIVVIDDIISHLQEMQEMLIAERELEHNPTKRRLRRVYERRRNLSRHPLQYGVEISVDDLSEEMDHIAWLHPVILSKAWRYLTEKAAPPRLLEVQTRRPNLRQLPSSVFVIEECIKKSTFALNSFLRKRSSQNERASEMLKLLEQIQQGVQLTK